MFSYKSKLSALLLAVFIISLSVQAQSYKLKYNFSKGKTYHYNSEMIMESTQEMMGQEMKINNESKISSKYVVDDVDKDGNQILIASIDSGSAHIKTPMNDNTTPLTEFTGKRTKITLTPAGKLSKREIIDTVTSHPELAGMLQQSVGGFARLPEKEVKTGDNWVAVDTVNMNMMGGVISNISNMTYTFAGKEVMQGHNCAKLNFTGDTKTTGKGNIQGMGFSMDGGGKITGTAYFDLDKGVVLTSEANANSEMTMAMTGQQNMIIPITQVVKTTQNLVNE